MRPKVEVICNTCGAARWVEEAKFKTGVWPRSCRACSIKANGIQLPKRNHLVSGSDREP